jgi:hypothetical protein
MIKNLPEKYKAIWEKCEPLLKQARPDDLGHAEGVVETVLNYKGNLKLDLDVLVPVAMMHDVAHYMILPEHFKYITGPEKIANGKIAHMLVGAKIAKDILDSVGYDKEKTVEVVDIIKLHDGDQLKGADMEKIYDTENKKIFHDIDSLDRYTMRRVEEVAEQWEDKNVLIKILEDFLKLFFYEEFRKIAEEGMMAIKKRYAKNRV